ncbi:VPA1262 family protein [Basfia succiniciproducens]|uniref:VPA1262 family protein n=1 Tax=Basfia succiniciproducens TaxID=653940 RepID=UPI003FCDBEDF
MLNEFINYILNDKRMNNLFDGIKPICLQIWVLELQERSQVDYHLLYGRVLPYDYQNNQWISDLSKHNKMVHIDKELKAKIVSLQLTTSAGNLNVFITNLLRGGSFLESSKQISVNIDEKQYQLLDLLKLSSPYCIRPVMHLPPRDNYVWDTPKVSPNSEASYDSAAITLLGKENFWKIFGISRTKKILELVNEKLKCENIDIGGIDAWRLGDLEFLSSPRLTNQEKRKFQLELKKQNRLEIFEEISEHPLIAILKLFNGDNLLFTSIQEFQVTKYPFKFEFNIEQHCNELFNVYTFEIFEKDGSKVTMLAQEGHPLVRTIHVQSNAISNISSTEKDPWLETGLPKSSLNKAKNFTSIERLNNHRSEFSVSNDNKDPWFDSNIGITNYLKIILPKQTESHFFPKLAFNGESRLELVEWLKKIIHKYPNAQIAWFDPFMENVGINLLNRLGFHSGNYIIFTSENSGESYRIQHLVRQCENWAETIGSVKLKVIGLDKLHDRMILIREHNGKPLAGYHLSNSIQRANENNPLLVTEIPLNVLYPVFSYVDELIQSQKVSNKPAIFDSTVYQPKSQNEKQSFDTKSPYQFPKLGWVLAKWWKNSELYHLSDDALKAHLYSLELDIENHKEKYINIPLGFFNDSFSSKHFVEEWDAFGCLLAHIPADKYYYEIGNLDISATLTDKLISYLEPTRKNALLLRHKNTVLDLNNYLAMSFDKLICDEYPERVFQHDINEISYSDYYAIKFLWHFSPESIINWLNEQLSMFNKKNNRQRALITDALRYICGDFECLDKWAILFKSNHHLLQWIGISKITSLFFEDKIDEHQICQIIDEHSTLDKSKIFLWVIKKSIFRKNEFKTIFLAKIIELSGSMNDNRLAELLSVLREKSGKLCHTYCWILKYVLEPMVFNKMISYNQIMNVWLRDLEIDWSKAIKNSHEYVYFKAAIEGQFSDEIVYLFSKLSENEQDAVLSRFDKVINLAIRIVRKPLSRALDYSLYINAFKVNIWILAIFNRLSRLKLSEEIISKIEDKKKLLSDIYERYELQEYGNEELLSYYAEY